MAWKTIDRTAPVVEGDASPVLSEAVREKIRSFLVRYETSRAALLPALHVAQDAARRPRCGRAPPGRDPRRRRPLRRDPAGVPWRAAL